MIGFKETLKNILKAIIRLPNYYKPEGGSGNRPTTANIDSDNSGSVIQFLSTGSMTEGKPTSDGNILHFNWDNSDKWASQLAIPHNEGGFIQWRAQKDGTTWKEWHDIWYDPVEIPANTDLNVYKYPSTRYCPASATAAALTNCPTTEAFFLYIEKANRPNTANTDAYQYYTQTIKDIKGKVYIRSVSCNNGTWSYGSWGNGAVHIANNLTTANAGSYVLDAYQGKVLKDSIPTGAAASKSVANNLTTASAGSSVLDAYQGKVLNDKFGSYLPKTGGTLSGNLAVSHSDTTESNLRVTNSKVNGTLYAASGGGLGIWNSTLGHAVISEDLNGNCSIRNFGSTTRTTTTLAADTSAHRYNAIGFEKIGHIVRAQIGILYNLPASTDTTIGTAPTGYRPAMVAQTMVFCTTTGKGIRINIATDGVMKAYNYGAAATGNVNLQAELVYFTLN